MKLIDLTGQTFGRMLVLERAANNGKQPAWLCVCECGTQKVVQGGNLRDGNVQSCGCLRASSGGHAAAGTQTYNSWKAMRARTCDPTNPRYADYGGRGIRVCDRWRDSFAAFLDDMGERPSDRTLDRIDNDGHYEPTNCRWATASEQQRNQRRRKVAA